MPFFLGQRWNFLGVIEKAMVVFGCRSVAELQCGNGDIVLPYPPLSYCRLKHIARCRDDECGQKVQRSFPSSLSPSNPFFGLQCLWHRCCMSENIAMIPSYPAQLPPMGTVGEFCSPAHLLLLLSTPSLIITLQLFTRVCHAVK